MSLRFLRRLIQFEEGEGRALLWACAFFFCVLSGYYVIRPVRETFGVQGNETVLAWLFTGTFATMLLAVPIYSALVARFPRRTFLPAVYHFFTVNLLIFYGLFELAPDEAGGGWISGETTLYVSRAFFIWVSVFNLFAVTVLRSFMLDIFSQRQGRRLFGVIAAGGTLGALFGSWLTGAFAEQVGVGGLFLFSIVLIQGGVFCIARVNRLAGQHGEEWRRRDREAGEMASAPDAAEDRVGGGVWTGFLSIVRSFYLIGICLFMFLATYVGTVLYFAQADLVRRGVEEGVRQIEFFAHVNMLVQSITFILQLLLASRSLRFLGVAVTLSFLPFVCLSGFVLSSLTFQTASLEAMLWVIIAFQVTRRAVRFGLAVPSKEILFTVVSREDKYKAKSFIDTVVYRGGDAASAWIFEGLAGRLKAVPFVGPGIYLWGIMTLAVPVALIWLMISGFLGWEQRRLTERQRQPAGSSSASSPE